MDKYVHSEPYGICLIIGAWNYPFLLTLSPLIGALAAGNCAVLKPSELAPNSAAIMAAMIERYLDTSCIRVVLGAVDQAQILLQSDIDHVFYTGSTAIGKLVMKAVAEKMIPVILECGGKSPVYIADDANIAVTAKRIAWGKTINCGQTW
jgi:aldehyde dehydrogenase (NAD+)